MEFKIDKKKLVEKILSYLQDDLKSLVQATAAAKEAATGEESAAENEYDTRATEASYLAGAQQKRVSEIEKMINGYKNLILRQFKEDDEIAATALVELECAGKMHYYFLSPLEGGKAFEMDGVSVNIISPRSPLGEELIGRNVEDIFEVETPHGMKSFFVASIA